MSDEELSPSDEWRAIVETAEGAVADGSSYERGILWADHRITELTRRTLKLRAERNAMAEHLTDWLEQCGEGLKVDHDCPAVYALASILTDLMDLGITEDKV